MDYANFLMMRDELSLLAVLLLVLVFDIFSSMWLRRHLQGMACILLGVQILVNLFPVEPGEAFGGMYVVSPMVSLMKTILSVGTLIVFLQSYKWVDTPEMRHKKGEFYILTLATLLGMYLMVSAGNFLLFFIGLELASLPMAALIAMEKRKHNSYEAGAKYIFTAAFASAILLYGLSLIYGTVGTMYFDDISAGFTAEPLQILALVFFIAGVGFKISIVPFHLWTADVYQGAPTQVSSYLSVISKGAGAFALMVILFKVFAGVAQVWQPVLYGLIIATIIIGNLFALRQTNLKRFLAFSSVSQAGYILLGVISGTALGMTGVVYYVLVYVFSNLAAFGVIAAVEYHTGKVERKDYDGLYASNPRLALVMMLAMFSLAGIPPFAGFFSKFFIFAAAASQGYYVLVFIALVNTVVSLYYYLVVVKAMFIHKADAPLPSLRTDRYMRAALVACVTGMLLLGVVSAFYTHIDALSFGIL